jgi:hypothetical protein
MTAEKPPTRTEAIIALGFIGALLFAIVLLTAALHAVRRSDFVGYYTGGLIIRTGNASKLYDLSEQARIQQRLFQRKDLLLDNHPPFEALWFAALARLDYVKAYILWGAINIFLWIVFQHLLRPYTPIPRNPYRYFLLCSLFVPLCFALMQGQTSVLLLLMFSLSFVCIKRGEDFKAGIFLGLGLLKFPVVLPFALICCLRSKWRMMAGFAAAASLLALLSVMAVGVAGVGSYVNLLIDMIRNPGNPAYWSIVVWKMPTIRGFFAALLTGRVAAGLVSILAEAVSALLILFVAWKWRRADREEGGNSQGLMFAAALAISLVVAPHLYLHDLTLLLLAQLLVIGSPQWSQKSSPRVVLTSIMVILYCPPVYALLLSWQAVYLLAPLLVIFAFAAISLTGRAAVALT